MTTMIRMLIIILLLAPLTAPVSAAAPMGDGAMMHHTMDHDMPAGHDCCEDQVASSTTGEPSLQMFCDGSCSDCQHFCSTTALLPSLSVSVPVAEQRTWSILPLAIISRQDRLERPPMPANI